MTDRLHAKTFKGLEQVLADELKEIGAEQVEPVNRGVNFTGSISMMYKANLYLRTALRILKPIKEFKVLNEESLYKKIYNIDWSEYMSYKNSIAIDAVVFSKVFRNSHYVEQRVKDAIVDQFRDKTSLRPSVDLKNADIRINIHVNDVYFTISLDSSGESLHKRGYRKQLHSAPLSEVLAAGLVKLSGWNGESPFNNPMCGSGTIAIEAAMIGMNIIPGSTGRRYAFQNWPDFDELLFDRILESVPPERELKHPIQASDIDESAIRSTKANIRSLDLKDSIKVVRQDFFKSDEIEENSTIVINPPYGERLEMDDINSFYSEIGSVFKHKCTGSTCFLFSSNGEATKNVGLKADSKVIVYNASLDCRYIKYSIFKGNRKEFKSRSI